MEPVGILKAWTAKVRMNRARMTATTTDSRYSRATDFLGVGGDPDSFSLIPLQFYIERGPAASKPPWGARRLLVDAQDGQEGLLRDVDRPHPLHALLALLLLLEELALAGDVAAVALGEDVLAEGLDGLAGDDPGADGGLDRHLEHLPRDHLPHLLDEGLAPGEGRVLVDDQRERVHRIAVDEHVQLHEGGVPLAGELTAEGGGGRAARRQAAVEVEEDLVERQLVLDHHPRGRDVVEALLDAALLLAELQDRPHELVSGQDGGGDDRLLDRLDRTGVGEAGRGVHFDHVAVRLAHPVADR